MAVRRIYSQHLFAVQLQFWQTNNAQQRNKQWAFVSLSAAASGRRNIEYRHIANALTLHVTSDKTFLLQIFVQRQLASALYFSISKSSHSSFYSFFNFSFGITLRLTKVLSFDKT